MKIKIKTPQDITIRSIAFTPIDDFLLDKLVQESYNFITNGNRRKETNDITLEIHDMEYKLFIDYIAPLNRKNFFPFLFAFPKIDWLKRDWSENEIIQKLVSFYFDKKKMFPDQNNEDQKYHQLVKGTDSKENQDEIFKDLGGNLERLNIGKEAIEFELRKQENELEKYLQIKKKITSYDDLKTNLSKLKKETDIYDDQVKQIIIKLDELIKIKNPLLGEEEELLFLTGERSKLLEQHQTMSHNEKFAQSQMEGLDEELNITNTQGIEYIGKLESIEKQIFDIGQSLGQINDTKIPEHVVKKINEYNDTLREYFLQLNKIEFIYQQIGEFEESIMELKEQQKITGQPKDLKEKIVNLESSINDTSRELERLKGREESLIEGEKLLANSICPIIEKPCTTIDEPVEDYFKRKLSVVSVDRSKLLKQSDKLEKQLEKMRDDQKLFHQWSSLQAKIFHTMDILMEAFEDFNREEEKLNTMPIGEEALIVIELLENLFSPEIIEKFHKSFLMIGKRNSSPDLQKRVETYRKIITNFEDDWKSVFKYFRDLVKKTDSEDEQLIQKREQYITQKNQMRKEYSIICQQVESIEKRRKNLSELLFEAGKVVQVNQGIEELNLKIGKVSQNVKLLHDTEDKERELNYKRDFLTGHIKGISTTEKKYKKELNEMKRKLNLNDFDHLDTKIASISEKVDTLQTELKLIGNRIDNIELQKRDIIFLNQKGSSKKQSLIIDQSEKTEKQILPENSNSNIKNANKNFQNTVANIQMKSDLVISEYQRRFPGDMPEKNRDALEKITKVQFLMRDIFGDDFIPLAVVSDAEELFWWYEFSRNNTPVLLIGPKTLKKQARIFN